MEATRSFLVIRWMQMAKANFLRRLSPHVGATAALHTWPDADDAQIMPFKGAHALFRNVNGVLDHALMPSQLWPLLPWHSLARAQCW